MEKINFINGQAPVLNGANLNQMQTNVEEEIENTKDSINASIGDLNALNTINKDNLITAINELKDELYYKSGDTYKTTQKAIYVGGTVTSGTKDLIFAITLPKSLKNISSIQIKSMTVLGRTTAGAYLNGSGAGIIYGTTTGITYNVFIVSENTILFLVSSTNAYTNVTNNTPVNVAVSNLELTFE